MDDCVAQPLHIEGFGQVAKYAIFDGLGRALPGRPPGHQQHGQIGVVLANRAQELKAGHARHHDVADDRRETTMRHLCHGFRATSTGHHLERRFEHAHKKAQHRGLVVHRQDSSAPAGLPKRQYGVFNSRLTHASTSLSDTQIPDSARMCLDKV